MNPKHKISADQIDILPTDPKYLEAAAELQREKDQRKQAEKLANWMEPKPTEPPQISDGCLAADWRKPGWWVWRMFNGDGHWVYNKDPQTDIAAAHELLEKLDPERYYFTVMRRIKAVYYECLIGRLYDINKCGPVSLDGGTLPGSLSAAMEFRDRGDTPAEAICNAFEKHIDWERGDEPK